MAVTQAQIAELAGVSRGTVDRVLNNRGRVNEDVAARIRKIADELGYQRNRAGSLLVRAKRPLRIGVIIQSCKTPFIESLIHELEPAQSNTQQLGAELVLRTYDSISLERQLAALDELEQEQVDGIAMTPFEDERIRDRINELAAHGIPVVTFNTDMPGSRRLCYVGQDNYRSGRAAAGLMNLVLGGEGKVLMIAGHFSNLSHRRRIEGFRSEIKDLYPGISLLPLEYSNDERELAYEIVRRVLTEQPDVRGIFLAANGQAGVCDAIRELGLRGKVHFLCYDLIRENIENLRSGYIDMLIDQDAHMQAVRPLEVLIDYLLTGARPTDEYMYTHIDIRTMYNI